MNNVPLDKKINNKEVNRSGPYRVMLVDDSSVIRGLLSRWLSSDPAIEIVSSVANGQVAVNSIERTDPEIVVLDIEMPVMDGLTALPLILKAKPELQVLMSSTLTSKNAQISLKAMSLGAADYIPKPTTNREIINSKSFQTEIIEKVISLASSKRKLLGFKPYCEKGLRKPASEQDLKNTPKKEIKQLTTIKASRSIPKILGVGSSTGGPQALLKFLNGVKGDLNIPVVITQHMPAAFTKILAGHLSKATGLNCHKAEDGMPLQAGHVYIAPGENHMLIVKKGGKATVKLTQDPQENFCRPAVDPMFRSLSKEYGPAVLAVILTGMGHDGLEGSKVIVNNGGTILAQNQETSVVWGMPGAVSEAGICHAILPLEGLGSKVKYLVKGGR